jgi:carboxymethylenebutenolidase
MKTVISIVILIAATLPIGAQEHVTQRLERSPRHHEWVEVKGPTRAVHCFVVYPEVKDKASAVLVIHENKGLTDWVRSVADQLAEAGYIAIAPDLLSGMAPEGGNTADFPSGDAATKALATLTPEGVIADLNAVGDYVLALPACNGNLTVAGFCWGGAQSLRFATERRDLRAAFVFYGTFPHTDEQLSRIECPVYGFYGGNDARVNATVPATVEAMAQLGKEFEHVMYEGAGHGFMRSGEDPKGTEANKTARASAWERWKGLLKEIR